MKVSLPRSDKVWIVSELFYPDEVSTGYIMTAIAEAISERREVHVICGPSGYDGVRADDSNRNFSFTVHRISAPNFNKNYLAGRVAKLFLLSLGMFWKGLFSINRHDQVLIVTNPAFLLPFYGILKYIKRFKLVILVHDVFPENLIVSKILKSENAAIYRALKWIFKRSYRTASELIVLGRDMAQVFAGKARPGQQITQIENWADVVNIYPTSFQQNALVQKFQLNQKVLFTFAGNIGRLQGLEYLFSVIKQVNNPLVHFLFVGDGALAEKFKAEFRHGANSQVTFAGPMPRTEQNLFLNASHVGLVTLEDSLYGLGVPSKSYNILAAGKPILFIGNKATEIAEMVLEHHCGYVFSKSDEEKLVDWLNSLTIESLEMFSSMGLTSRALAEKRYAESTILEKYKTLFNG